MPRGSASGGSRPLPAQPSLRYLKMEAKRRLAAGEFPALHDAQIAFVIWAFGLIAVIRLWQAASSAYFKATRP